MKWDGKDLKKRVPIKWRKSTKAPTWNGMNSWLLQVRTQTFETLGANFRYFTQGL